MKRVLLTTLLGVVILLCGTGLFALGYYYHKQMETETDPLADAEIGLDYEHTSLRSNCSFAISDQGEITFKPSNNHVIDYVVGSLPGRETTTHGYEDRILIEFHETLDTDPVRPTLVRVGGRGNRGDCDYRIQSLEHALVKIELCGDHYHVEGTIKITAWRDGKFSRNYFELVHISRRTLESNRVGGSV